MSVDIPDPSCLIRTTSANDRRIARPLLLGSEWVTTRAGGLNRYFSELFEALARWDCEPLAVVVGEAPVGAVGVSDPAARLPLRIAAVRGAAGRLSGSAEVVDAHFALYALAPLLTTSLRHLPLVVHFQGPWAQESALVRGQHGLHVTVKRFVERAVYCRASAVVVLSAAFKELVVRQYGVDPTKVYVIPPGVDLDRFCPGDRREARRSLNLEPDAFCIAVVRRLETRMGLDVLLEAWADVQRDRADAVLVIAGDGRRRESLERARLGLPQPEGVRFLGRISDAELVRLYQAADCSVVPSRDLEGFGLVTLESLACGSAAIVTDVGGLPDGVRGLDRSLIVRSEDSGALAARILAAAGGDLPGRAACRAHAEGFSWGQVARRHMELYHRVCAPKDHLRVVFLDHTARLSGAELALGRILPALGPTERHVVLAEDGPLVGHLHARGEAVEVLPLAEEARGLKRERVRSDMPLRAIAATAGHTVRLARRLRQLEPDLVHANSLKALIYGGVAGRLAGIPVVWHVHDRIEADYLPRAAVRMVRAAARVLPCAVVANSTSTLDSLRLPGRIPAVVVPCPVVAAPSSPHGDQPFTVGIVGRLAPWKGQDLFLRAFATAFPDGDTRGRIVGSALFGEDEWGMGLVDLAEGLGIRERVDFVGFVDDIAAEYAQMDVLVHASTIPEPFGQVVLEGMVAGLAVVAADAGGPAEAVRSGTDGLLYQPGDIDGLAERLRLLYGDPDLRARLGEAGRQRAAEFTPETVARSIVDVYHLVLERRWRRHRTTGRRGLPLSHTDLTPSPDCAPLQVPLDGES